MASTFTMYVQVIAVIMCMCTHKVIKSHRSLLMLPRVNVFAIECIYPVKVVWVASKQLLVS